MSKTIEEYFRDWESQAFGFGYGTGEEYTINALKKLSDLVELNPSSSSYIYDHEVLEKELDPEVTWLLINILCKNGDIEYGTSPRYGWFYGRGRRLINFIKAHSVDELYDMTSCDSDYSHCFSDYCSCGYKQVHHKCRNNPFWNDEVPGGSKPS